jgi:RNA polymerase sigma factor (sigma-70 family)
MDEQRSHRARDRWRIRSTEESDRWLYHEVPEPEQYVEPHPEEVAAKELLAEELLSCLTPLQREAVELCVMNNLPNHVAAELLGCRPNTIDKRLERARKRMRAHASELADRLND